VHATDITVKGFIGGLEKAFIIPPYQRNYAWGLEQCLELFGDIMRCVDTNGTHYIGNVVYYLGENSGGSFTELILVDGQQRITTLLLLLCALRDVTNDKNLQVVINEQYLCNKGATEDYRIRLKQTVADADSFIAIIDGVCPQESSGNVVKNYEDFKKKLSVCPDKHKAVLDAIARIQLVDVNLQISSTSKDSLRIVQTIFEKINSTGKPLSQADLIRNFLLIAPSVEKQNKWHKNYWLMIEKNLGADNISAFARDFLRMIWCEEIRESDTYRDFKDYVSEDKAGDQELVLKELLRFSKPYAWLLSISCPDESLNRELQMLRNLRSNDFAPLVLYLIDRLYGSALSELRRIIHLIVDFLLRMRIASPTTGSGTTRSLLFGLIRKMRDGGENAIDCTYDSILFELSNSPTLAGEFPSDMKFATALQGTFYPPYARELLLRIEEYETKNIPVDISKVTVEHLMPQTLSDWWKRNLGGYENAERIRLTCTNTVGNFAIVSQGYNSSMSNKPWHEKRKALEDVQFTVTSSVASIEQWNEEAILTRGNDLAIRATQAITSPLPRTRDYRSRLSSEVSEGLYPLLEGDDSLVGTSLSAVIFNGERKVCTTWSRLLSVVGAFLYSENPMLFDEAVRDVVWFSQDGSRVKRPVKISDSPWFCCGGGYDGMHFRNIAAKLAEKMDLLKDFQLEIVNPASND